MRYGNCKFMFWLTVVRTPFPLVLCHYWLVDRKGIKHVKLWVLVCWWWRFDWSFACFIAPVVSTTTVILSSNKIQTGDILVSANPDPPGKWLLKRRDGCWNTSGTASSKTVSSGMYSMVYGWYMSRLYGSGLPLLFGLIQIVCSLHCSALYWIYGEYSVRF